MVFHNVERKSADILSLIEREIMSVLGQQRGLVMGKALRWYSDSGAGYFGSFQPPILLLVLLRFEGSYKVLTGIWGLLL